MFAMEQEHQEKELDAKQEYQSIRDEIKNKASGRKPIYLFIYLRKRTKFQNVEERHALRIQLEGQTEDLWKQIREVCSRREERHAVFWRTKNPSSANEAVQRNDCRASFSVSKAESKRRAECHGDQTTNEKVAENSGKETTSETKYHMRFFSFFFS